MIGNTIVGIDNDDLITGTKKYIGTHGLCRLLTYIQKNEIMTYIQKKNLNNFSRVLLFDTNSICKNNDPPTKN